MDIIVKQPRRRRLKRRLFTAFVAVFCLPVAFVWLINQQWLVVHTLRVINFKSPTQIAVEGFRWKPLSNSIEINGLGIHYVPNGRDAWAGKIRLKYKPLGFLRGKFIVDDLSISGIDISIPPTEKGEKEHKTLNITKLFLLHSLIVEKARVNSLSIAVGKDITLRTNKISWSLNPRFTGDTLLDLSAAGFTLHKLNEQILSADEISLAASTSLSRWKPELPYLNALHGDISAKSVRAKDFTIDKIGAVLDYDDDKIALKDLDVNSGGNDLLGSLSVDVGKQDYGVSIHIPKPIHVPHLGKQLKTISTAGEISGTIEASGHGFDPMKSYGKGRFALKDRFDASPDSPVEIAGEFNWSNGAASFQKIKSTVDDATVNGEGTVDIARKHMKFNAVCSKFPIEAIFEKFTNPHLRKIYGVTDADVSFEGWGTDFVFKCKGKTVNGGFKPIVGERIETDLEIDYDKFQFAWKVFQDGRQTGTADLVINMGSKTADDSRVKIVDLKAKAENQDLARTLPGFGLTGMGGGEITIKGPHTNFTGTAKVALTEGSWLKLPLDSASTEIDLSNHKITFKNATVKPSSFREMPFINPLVMDLSDGRFRLHGNPYDGTTLDLTYVYASKTASIERISYEPPDRPGNRIGMKGQITSGGGINLGISGSFDLSLLEPVGSLVREASGPVDLNVRLGGTAASPLLSGTLKFQDAMLSPRIVHLDMEKLNGTLRFEGHRIFFDGINAAVEDGEFAVGGWIEHQDFKPSSANLTLDGKSLGFRTADNSYRMEFDGKLSLTGAFPHPLLAGDINILDGRYTKDFVLIEQLSTGKKRYEEEKESIPSFDPRLDLTIRNSGDLLIRNNIGDIDLKVDVNVKGTRAKPQITGAIDTREGKINYLGLKFDITRGFIEFRDPFSKPYLEVEAERELRTYNLHIRLYGRTDNLALDLEGTSPTGPLEKRDIVSLLAFGITEQERREATDTQRKGSKVGVSVAASQVGQLIERPVTEMTHLDIFRIESAEPEETDEPGKVATRLRVGKQLTDRLSVDFSTDIDTTDSEQTVTAEYLVTDNVILKGSRSSNAKYKIRGGLRFRLR